MKTFIICGLLLSAPLAILGLKCYDSNADGTATLKECASSDQVCAIIKGKLMHIFWISNVLITMLFSGWNRKNFQDVRDWKY